MKTAGYTVKNKDDKYLVTIREMRAKNFSRNIPFLILSDRLPEGQVYREFADGRIEIQEVFVNGKSYEAKAIQTLEPLEADKVRYEYGLY